MASHRGFQYELNTVEYLKTLNLTPSDFIPPKSNYHTPDLILLYNEQKSGCELKISNAFAGSLVLKYDIKDPINPWKFNAITSAEPEKELLKKLADDIKLFDIIKNNWAEIPYKREQDSEWKATIGKISPYTRYIRDYSLFKDIKGIISPTIIEEYYNKKNTYYINIGTHGFYKLGIKNPLNLKNVPIFSNCASANYRVRVQSKGSGNYQFTFELQFRINIKSIYNIAPIIGTNINIQKNKVNISCFNL